MKNTFLMGLMVLSSLSFGQITRFVYEANIKPSKEKSEKVTEIFILDTSQEKSVFYSEAKVKRDSTMQRMRETRNFNFSAMEGFRNATNYIVEKDLLHHTIIFQDRIGRDNYMYTENPNLDWKLSQDLSQIGDYKVQKAEVNYAGRQWIAWFAPDLPYINGPYKFSGLPGLIIKLEDSAGDYSFDLKEVKKVPDFITLSTGMGQTIKTTKEKFKKLQKNYLQDPISYMNAQRMSSGRQPNIGGENDSQRRDREKRMTDEIKSRNNLIELD